MCMSFLSFKFMVAIFSKMAHATCVIRLTNLSYKQYRNSIKYRIYHLEKYNFATPHFSATPCIDLTSLKGASISQKSKPKNN